MSVVNSNESREKGKKTVPVSSYQRHIQRAKDASNWIIFSRWYVKITSKLTALFLQDINNIASLPNIIRKNILNEEYFLCTAAFLSHSIIGWTKREQVYHFQLLKEKGYVKLLRRGKKGARWVHICHKKIEDDVDAYIDGLPEGTKTFQQKGT